MKKRPRSFRKVLLDSNIWRYIVDADEAGELYRLSVRYKVKIQIAPSVLYEALRMNEPNLRRRLTRVMTRPCWARLMPEAYEESRQLLSEIRRLHPDWLREGPAADYIKQLRFDWMRLKGGFWDRARFDTDDEADRVQILGGNKIELARSYSEEARSRFIQAKLKFETFQLDNLKRAQLEHPVDGWDGDAIDLWRIDGLNLTWRVISSRIMDNAYSDWLLPKLDLKRENLSFRRWVRFWFYEVNERNMSKFWIRSAFEVLQSLRKVSAGTPCDSQLATYLTESEHFVTADRVLAQIVEKCRPVAPVMIAKASLVPGGARAIPAIFEIIAGEK